MCDSDRGEWGKPCPDCGVMLPARQGPLVSWQSQRPGEWPSAKTDRRWTPEARATREATWRRKHDALTERQMEILRIVQKHGGNRNAAARELGITGPSVVTTLKTLRAKGVAVPEGVR